MCGIVGLHLRNPELYPRLGELLAGMLTAMEARGADSAGIAVYGDPEWSLPGQSTISLIEVGESAEQVAEALGARLNTIHNLRYYQRLMQGLRDAIDAGTLDDFVAEFYRRQGKPLPPQIDEFKSVD